MSNVRFGINNYVKNCTITSVPTAVVTADNLKTEWRARQGKWNDFSAANQPAAALLSGDRTSLITVEDRHSSGLLHQHRRESC